MFKKRNAVTDKHSLNKSTSVEILCGTKIILVMIFSKNSLKTN